MKHSLTLVAVFGCLCAQLVCAEPAGWKVIRDKTNACQISVPSTWTALSTPGLVNSPVSTTTMLIAGHRPYRPFDEDTLKMLNIGKLYENSAARLFYVTKPNEQGHITYHIEAPGSGNACIAEMTLTARYSEDEAKKIAMTVTAAK